MKISKEMLMEEKELKSYLAKYKESSLFQNREKRAQPLTIQLSVRIKPLDFGKAIKACIYDPTPLRKALLAKEQIESFKKILLSDSPKIISLVKAVKGVKMVEGEQNLLFLHYTLIYRAIHRNKDKPIKGWKITCPLLLTNKFYNFLHSYVKEDKHISHTISLIKIAQKNAEDMDTTEVERANLALEREYSQRRNYHVTHHLHT